MPSKRPKKGRPDDAEAAALDAIKEMYKEPQDMSRLTSLLLGEDVKIIKWVEPPEFHPHFPDLLILQDDTVYHFEFFAKAPREGTEEQKRESIANEMCLAYLMVRTRFPMGEPVSTAVWVGEGLCGPKLNIDSHSLKYRCPLYDIRENLDDRPELKPRCREIIARLRTVHMAHGGLFQRLLELGDEEHQRQFTEIARKLGYESKAVKIDPL